MDSRATITATECAGDPERGYAIDLISYAVGRADEDADRVLALLRIAGLHTSGARTIPIPPEILLELAAVLRMRAWELAGIHVHREAGLPEARLAFDELLSQMERPHAQPGDFGRLSSTVASLCANCFVFAAPEVVGAEVLLSDFLEEDESIEAVARLFSERPDLLVAGGVS